MNTSCFPDEFSLKINIPYQIAQIFEILLSCLGCVLVTRFSKRKLTSFAAHRNVKILLHGYFASIFLSALTFIITQSYEVILAFTYKRPCDVAISPIFHRITVSLISFCLLTQIFFQGFLVLERIISTIYVRTYEAFGIQLGATFLFITLLITLILLWFFYPSSLFSSPVISSIRVPSQAFAGYAILAIGIIVGLLASLIMLILAFTNSRRKLEIEVSLTSKYQRTENIRLTNFLAVFVFAHSILMLIYCFSQFILVTPLFNGFSKKLTYLLHFVFYMDPLISVVLPLVGDISLKKLQFNEFDKKQKLINIPIIGEEAGEYYRQLLYEQWK